MKNKPHKRFACYDWEMTDEEEGEIAIMQRFFDPTGDYDAPSFRLRKEQVSEFVRRLNLLAGQEPPAMVAEKSCEHDQLKGAENER